MLEYLPDETEVLVFNGNHIPFWKNNVIGMVQEHEILKVLGKMVHDTQKLKILLKLFKFYSRFK